MGIVRFQLPALVWPRVWRCEPAGPFVGGDLNQWAIVLIAVTGVKWIKSNQCLEQLFHLASLLRQQLKQRTALSILNKVTVSKMTDTIRKFKVVPACVGGDSSFAARAMVTARIDVERAGC